MLMDQMRRAIEIREQESKYWHMSYVIYLDNFYDTTVEEDYSRQE